MEIVLIVVRDPSDPDGIPWVDNAWDEYTLEGMEGELARQVDACAQTHGAQNVRLAKVVVPDNFLAKVFAPVTVNAKLLSVEELPVKS